MDGVNRLIWYTGWNPSLEQLMSLRISQKLSNFPKYDRNKFLGFLSIPFPSEFRRNECEFRLNKIENGQRATQLCQKENQFFMNGIHFRSSETQFHTKNRLA